MSSVTTPALHEPGTFRFTVEEYHKLAEVGILQPKDRVELLDGEILVMSPIGVRHAQALDWSIECLVEQHRQRYLVSPRNPVSLDEYSQPQPDFMLVPRLRNRARHPRAEEVFLLVEISDTTLALDRKRKLQAYATAGVCEYWIINLQEDVVEVFREPRQGRYAVELRVAIGEMVSPLGFPDVLVPVAQIIPPR